MYPVVGPVGTIPSTVLISFLMLGIDDIGCRVEQPFDNLPLWQYCQCIDDSCEQLLRMSKMLYQLECEKEALAPHD